MISFDTMTNIKELETTELENEGTINTKKVHAYYDEFEAIKGITMNIMPQSATAFIGPSGCGKSTFLRLLNR
jgi:phosphate transport system ATP-binding protein